MPRSVIISYEDLDDLPEITDGTNNAELKGTIEVSATSGNVAGVNIDTNIPGTIGLEFTLPKGENGISPEVSVSTSGKQHTITITDEEHPNGQSVIVNDGQDAVNPFKGWFDNLTSLQTITPVIGDYGYVKGATTTDPVKIYECTTNGTWSDSGREVDTSNVQSFATGQAVNEVAIDGTGLVNPASNALSKATDVMQLAAKLEGVTAEETKVQAMTSGDGTNVFVGYVMTKGSNVPRIVASSGTTSRHIVIDVEGCDYVRFIGILAKTTTGDGGYAFYDASNYSNGTFLTDNTGAVFYSDFDVDTSIQSTTTKEYRLKVPNGAKYLKLCYNFGGIITPQNFYCYLGKGNTIIQSTGIVLSKKIKLVGGVIDPNNGNMNGALYSSLYFKGYILPTRLRVYDTDRIISVSGVPAGGTLEMYCFDEGFVGIGKISNFPTGLPDGTRYVRPYISFTSEKLFDSIEITVTADTRGQLEIVKDGIRSTQTPGETTRFFGFPLNVPSVPSTQDSDPTWNFIPNGQRSFGNGYIQFARNYTADGEPTPVIVFFHGTAGYYFRESSIRLYQTQIQFLAKCGYNVIDCNTHDYYEWFANNSIAENKDAVWPLPTALECYARMWEFVKNTYNVDESCVYALCKSAGGMLINAFSSLKPNVFNFKAIGMLAPSLEAITNMLEIGADANNYFLSQVGCLSPNVLGGLSGYYDGRPAREEDRNYILANLDKILPYDCWFANLLDTEKIEFITQILDTGNTSSNLLANETLTSIIANSNKILQVPCKIWHAIDDDNVPLATSIWFKQTVRNAGGECYLRQFPANCGKHHAVDTSSDPDVEATIPKTSYQTPFGETITISTAYAEYVEWIKLW